MVLQRSLEGNYYDTDDPGEPGYGEDYTLPRRSVTDQEARILASLARGKTVLEIGTGLAVSTRALASRALRVVTVDVDPWVRDPGLPNVEFRRDLPPKDMQFDFVFIDGNHNKESVVADIESCRHIPLLVLHDTYYDSVQEAIDACGLCLQKAYDTKCQLAIYTHN